MFYIDTYCPICRSGLRGILRCSDKKTLVIICDECDAIWLDPVNLDADQALFVSPPDFVIPGLDCSVGDKQDAGWATRDEVKAYGWENFIIGESE